ncbi:MAG: hypothetical protein ACI8YQ_000121 [Polaribacter sp.]|jgi:hypothetical protein
MKNTIIFRYFFLVLFCCFAVSAISQNPFELEHRLEEGEVEVKAQLNPGNPFEKEALGNAVVSPPSDKKEGAKSATGFRVKKIQAGPSSRFKFWIMTISLVLLTLLFVLYSSLVSKAYRGFLNENFLKMIHRNEGRIVSIPYLLLYVLYFVSAATFIYLLSEHIGDLLFKEPVNQYFVCLAGVGLVLLVKHITLIILSLVFPIAKEIRQYSFTIIVFNIILGICLLPFNLFIAFTAPGLAQGLIYLALALILVLYIYRSFRGLLIAGRYLSFHKFHFFMYLCTIEIAPVLLIVALLNGGGVTH